MLSLLEINHTGVLLDLQGHRLFLWLQYDLKKQKIQAGSAPRGSVIQCHS